MPPLTLTRGRRHYTLAALTRDSYFEAQPHLLYQEAVYVRVGAEEGSCAVCLRQQVLAGNNPIRHGWAVKGVTPGQGLQGSWHTGPCPGVRFPHLGISTEGTKWALTQLKTDRDNLRKHRERLDQPRAVVLVHETGKTVKPTDPGYQQTLRVAIADAEAALLAVKADIRRYRQVIDEWQPATAKPRDWTRGQTLHKSTTEGKFAGRQTPLCKAWSGYAPYSGNAVYAKRDADVTCAACRKLMQQTSMAKAPKTITAPKGSETLGHTTNGWPVFGPSADFVQQARQMSGRAGEDKLLSQGVKEHMKLQQFEGNRLDHADAAQLHRTRADQLEAKFRTDEHKYYELWSQRNIHRRLATAHRQKSEF